jgi:hypothetical protein
MKRVIFFSLLFSLIAFCTCGQKIATLEVELSEDPLGIQVPVSVELKAVTDLSPSDLNLIEISNGKKIPVPFQVDKAEGGKLHWMVTPGTDSNGKHVFVLMKGSPDKAGKVAATDKDGTLTLHYGDQNLLRYYHKTLYPPEGVDTNYKRSAFIHPLWSPNGQVLTRIQPRDHYHHYGIWNPWCRLLFEGTRHNHWEIQRRQGTVRFADFKSVEQGPLYAGFKARHDHVVIKEDGSEKTAMKEIHGVRVYRPQEDQDFFIVDFKMKYTCATDSAVTLTRYRYQGFSWRTTEAWDNQNSTVLTSEGKTRKEANFSRARWCMVQGAIGDDHAGAVMMSYPDNFNHPEPLRIWPENQYGRGDMFANFNTAQDVDWKLEPGNTYVLKYRLLVFNGPLSSEKAEAAWHYFAHPPKIKLIKEE